MRVFSPFSRHSINQIRIDRHANLVFKDQGFLTNGQFLILSALARPVKPPGSTSASRQDRHSTRLSWVVKEFFSLLNRDLPAAPPRFFSETAAPAGRSAYFTHVTPHTQAFFLTPFIFFRIIFINRQLRQQFSRTGSRLSCTLAHSPLFWRRVPCVETDVQPIRTRRPSTVTLPDRTL